MKCHRNKWLYIYFFGYNTGSMVVKWAAGTGQADRISDSAWMRGEFIRRNAASQIRGLMGETEDHPPLIKIILPPRLQNEHDAD